MQPTRLLSIIAPIIVFIVPAALAQPHVIGISGTLAQDETLIIIGSGFGSKSPAAPVLVDRLTQYSNLADGDLIPTSAGGCPQCPWQRVLPQGDSVLFSTDSPRTAGGAAYRATVGGFLSHQDLGDAAPDRLLVNWWVRTSEFLDGSINDRLIRIRTRFEDTTSSITLSHAWLSLVTDIDQGGSPDYLHRDWGASPGTWHNLELQIDSNDIESGRGEVTVRAGGSVIHHADNCWADAPLNDIVILGFHLPEPDPDTTLVVDWTDIYIDTTFARVLISDSPNAQQGSRNELLVPANWTTNEIVVQVTPGSFSEGETVFLFVIDEEGTWSQGGYEMTVGGGAEVPGMPGQPMREM